jgi:hypothetical protein
MKKKGAVRQFLIAFLITAIAYAVLFTVVEKMRGRKGPWQVSFGEAAGEPAIVIDQPRLGITNVTLVFEGQSAERSPLQRPPWRFAEARPVPFDVPYGRVIFLDTTFLPGTVTMQLFGHEIEFIPRVLVLDNEEHAWRSGETIRVAPAKTLPSSPEPH